MKTRKQKPRKKNAKQKFPLSAKTLVDQAGSKTSSAEHPADLELRPARRERRGKGLTQSERDEYNLLELALLLKQRPDAGGAVNELFAKGLPTIWDQLARIEEGARSTLQDLGLPDSDEVVEWKKDGSWEPSNCDPKNCYQRLVLGLELALSKEEDSTAWYAAHSLRQIAEIRRAWPSISSALASAFTLGRLVEREWWKREHETMAVRGYRDEADRAEGRAQGTATAKANAAARYKVVVRVANNLWNSEPTLRNKPTETARRIQALKLDDLRMNTRNDFLGFDSIRTFLRRAKDRGDLK